MSVRARLRTGSFALALLLLACAASRAAAAEQTFQVRRGWNAVFLEVQPRELDPTKLFAGLPFESVWTWIDPATPVQFIRSPDEEPWNEPGWQGWFKASDKAALRNLHAVYAGRAYLIRSGAAATWTVQGAPSVRRAPWVPDSYNLAGLRVGSPAPTFAEYFAPSAAHAGEPIYRLSEAGEWVLVEDPTSERPVAGVAYWIYCRGASSYQGPLELGLPGSEGLDFGALVNELSLTLIGRATETRSVSLAASGPVVLAYRRFDPDSGYFEWPPLTEMLPVELGAGRQILVRLAVRREAMAPGIAEGVLSITDGAGVHLRVPVRAEKVGQ